MECTKCGKRMDFEIDRYGVEQWLCRTCGHLECVGYPARTGAEDEVLDQERLRRLRAELIESGIIEIDITAPTKPCERCGEPTRVASRYCIPCRLIVQRENDVAWRKAHPEQYKATMRRKAEQKRVKNAARKAAME